MLLQFSVAKVEQQLVVILTNTLFHDIDVLLIALIKPMSETPVLEHFHITVSIDSEPYFIDLLDIASVSKGRLKSINISFLNYQQKIKSGLDLLIDGF
ncbi:CcdB family protein [Rheinheimera salexigens]|uniref:Uncharacterized protein n=1 Tax=Rheinheimera salexigens TaxID=1628148 RepID=A0A1E7Q418_9GAMM|nr:CcdB family protein [Rheinheimera salexigens]OEY68925.1 hypothetical protein BI198_04600 [Rheinheimera salexigens]